MMLSAKIKDTAGLTLKPARQSHQFSRLTFCSQSQKSVGLVY